MTAARVLTACPVRARNWRCRTAAELLPVAEREAQALGAARAADLSGLDDLGTPCWQVVRPDAYDIPGNVTVLTGKGWDGVHARLGAYMECIERHWGERSVVEQRIARPSELTRNGKWFVPLAVMPLPLGVPDPGDVPLAWVEATTLDGRRIWVPAHDVLCPFVPAPGTANPAIWRSNGLAAGGHVTEAVFFGLLEVIERDAMAVAELTHVGTTVDLDDCPSPAVQDLREKLDALHIALDVKQVPAIGGVSVCAAFLDDRGSRHPLRLCGGQSAHVDPLLAIENAILEAVQTRAVMIAGGREDLQRHDAVATMDYEAARSEAAWWFDPTDARVASPAAALPLPSDLADVVHTIGERLRDEMFYPVAFIVMSPPQSEIAVVRVIVPTSSEMSHDSRRIGRRILASYQSASRTAARTSGL